MQLHESQDAGNHGEAALSPTVSPPIAARYRRWAELAGASAIAIGVLVGVGWLLDVPTLQRVRPALASMKLNTAVAVVLLGLALRGAIAGPPGRRTVRILAGAAAAIAAASLVENAFGLDLGIDQLVVRDVATRVTPGRMSPATGCALLGLAAAIAWIDTRCAEWLAVAIALAAHVAVLGYLYGVRDLYAIGPYASVALHTAVALYVLALGVVLARPERGVMRVMTSDSLGGELARRLVPAALVVPALLALVRQWGEQAGLYGTGVGRAMLVAANTVIFVGLILQTAAALARSDRLRRDAEAAVREREAQLAITLDSIGDGVIATDEHGRVVRMNPAAERLTGWQDSEARGRPMPEVFRIVNEDTGAAAESPVERVLREGVVVGLANHTVLVSRDATRRAIADCGAPIRSTDGMTRGVVLVFQDHSEARAAERRLRDSHDRLRTLAGVSEAFAGVATSYQPLLDTIARATADEVGDACMVTLISDDGQHLRGVANAHRDPALELDYRAFVADTVVPVATSASISAIVARTGQPQRADVEPSAIVARSDEQLRPMVARLDVHSFAVVPIRARGTVIGTLSLLRSRPGCSYSDDDLTMLQDLADRAGLAIENARLYRLLEQRVRERTAELEAANEQLETFSYSVAHDLRSPLRSISGFSDVLGEEYAAQLQGDGVQYLSRIRSAAQRMGHLIDDLLGLSRVGKTELRRERVELTALALRVVDRLRAGQPDRDVEIVVENGLIAHADPGLIDILLTNLLGNAWKFTGKRKRARIELAADPAGRPITYLVRDNGAGFAASHAGKLFGVFERLHSNDDFEGTGLGLATVQRVIHRHGGKVWAEGEVDKGATFFFTLESAPT